MSPSARSRGWCFTNFDVDFAYEALIKASEYVIYGLETCPETQRQHHQGYVYFGQKKAFTSVKKMLGTSHLEAAKGSPQSNIDYCSKDNNVTEHGTRPKQGDRVDLATMLSRVRENPTMPTLDIANFDPATWARNYRAIQEYKSLLEPKRDWVTQVIYVYGPSGSGKTKHCHEKGATPVTWDGKFLGGYAGEDVVLFDDVDSKTFTSRQFLLNILDRYPYNIRVSGGYRNWKPKTIYMTSNFPPEVTFEPIWDRAVERRISEIIFLQP